MDADSPWRDSSLEQLDLNALSRFRNIAERACGEFDERFTAECDSDRDFISNVIANNSIEQINLAIEKGNWWRSSDDENWCELVSRSSEIEPMLRSFISSYSTLDDLTAEATKLGFDLLSAVQIREQISTYQTFLTLCDVNESDVSEINRLKTAMEEKLERIEAVASEVENLRNLGISLSPRDFVSCYKNLSSISSESLVKRACAEIGIKDIVSEIRDAEAILKKAYEDFDHKQPLPQTVKVKEALNVISSAGFFTRFGKQYKESLAHAKGWYGYDLKSKLNRGLLIGKLDASLKLCRKLDGLTIGSSLGELHATDSKWLKSLGNRLEDCIMSCERTRLPAAYISKFLSSESTPKVFLFLESRRGMDTDWTFVDQEIAGVKSAIKFAETEHEAIRTADSFLKKSNLKFTDVSAILSSCDSYLEVGDMRMDLINQMGLPRSELNLERAESYLSLCKTISELHPSLVEGCFLENSQHQINLLESYSKLFEGIDSGMTDLSLGKGSTVTSNSALEVLESVRAHWSDQTNFQKLIQRQNIINEATEFGFESILTCLEKEGLLERVEDLIAAILASNLKEVAESKFGSRMLGYSGTSLNAARSRLKDVDTQLIALAPKAVESKCQRRANPPSGVGRGRKSEFTELALLNHELSKKRRTPPRKLLKRARVALMELFPCWMMVPTSVAQQLPREEVFDLVIIDEASQMTPETAISALMRSKQVLISGDTNQLPPTNFYQGINDNIDDEEDEDLAVDEESILEIANAMLYPKHRLQWHYRSKHEELIAFSNHYVYDNDLVIFPTPHSERKNMGVRLVRTDGVFNKKINPGEAQIMVEQVVEFMKEQPRRSLGVVVMNRDQMEQIYSMINRKADEVPEVAKYMDYWSSVDEGLQRFFVKNLENVQGDERDVIFIGTVYGKNPEGKFYHQFGPIGHANGKRRLNVLFSRAKEEIVTFSSIPMDLFNPNPNNEGANMLKLWLQYSATKRLGEKIVENEGSRAPDSPFEEHVIQVVKDMGFIPVPQVGVSNYSIDIGIKHSSYPMGYLCGVECDGATYHSAKSARDRDRLRQEVLEGLGWTLYRIWSTDWFRDPFGQSKHLKTFLESLLEEKLSQLSPETDNVSTELKSPLPREKTPASDHNLFVEEGSKVEIQYLNGSAPGVTAKFWITSQQVFENSALTADPFRKCSVSTPIAVAMIDSKAGDVVSYVAGNQSIEVKILAVS